MKSSCSLVLQSHIPLFTGFHFSKKRQHYTAFSCCGKVLWYQQTIYIDSIFRWIKSSLLAAGIDATKVKAHSTRSASSSYLASQSISVIDIMNSVGWSNEQVFQRYYTKPIENKCNYGRAILNSIILSC